MEKDLKQSILYLKKEEAEQRPEASKLLFTGLDDAGKTSIILSLQREFSKIAVLSPTRGAQRRVFDFLGKEIAEWDLTTLSAERRRSTYLRVAVSPVPTKVQIVSETWKPLS